MSRITVVGCGMMGGNIVDAFLDHGHDVTIVDVNRASALPRVERGARFSESLANALDSKFVMFSLPTDAVVRGVLSQCPRGSLDGKILVNATSETPSDVLALERDVCAAGGRYVDAAILTYQGEVGRRDACLLYSGDRLAFDEIEGELRSLSPNPLFLGDGVATAAEIVDVVVVAVHYGLVYAPLEGIARCAEFGVGADAYLAALGDLLMELAERALPPSGLRALGKMSVDDRLASLLKLMQDYNLFDRMGPTWMNDANRGVAAHIRKVLSIAESGFSC